MWARQFSHVCINGFQYPLRVITVVITLFFCADLTRATELKAAAWVALGEQVFHDTAFSRLGTVSCASCHQPEHAYADQQARAIGSEGRVGSRRTPSLLHLKHYTRYGWDGGQTDLRKQVLLALTNPQEQDLATLNDALHILNNSPAYASHRKQFGEIDEAKLAQALLAFILQLSPTVGQPKQLSAAAKRGQQLFKHKAGCARCHIPEQGFTDNKVHLANQAQSDYTPKQIAIIKSLQFKNLGEPYQRSTHDPERAALGHYLFSRDPKQLQFFRTPSLLQLQQRRQLSHNGAVTLNQLLGAELKRSNATLSDKEQADLLQWLTVLD
jgi:cytochrome c peroxidase